MAFKNFPTVYEAHGYFHSTLTPPLVVAIFLGLFWRKFTPAAVISTFVGGVALMIVGLHNPSVISPFDHGIQMDAEHPYSYIRALYNLVVCLGVAVLVTFTTSYQKKGVELLRKGKNHERVVYSLTAACVILFFAIVLNKVFFGIESSFFVLILLIAVLLLVALVSLVTNYYVKYDEKVNTEGLTAFSLAKAKATACFWLTLILSGKVSFVIGALRQRITKSGNKLTSKQKEDVQAAIRYYENPRQFMHYDE